MLYFNEVGFQLCCNIVALLFAVISFYKHRNMKSQFEKLRTRVYQLEMDVAGIEPIPSDVSEIGDTIEVPKFEQYHNSCKCYRPYCAICHPQAGFRNRTGSFDGRR